jgi:hypothetical protein
MADGRRIALVLLVSNDSRAGWPLFCRQKQDRLCAKEMRINHEEGAAENALRD